MAHEGIEVPPVCLLPEVQLHRSPEPPEDRALTLRIEVHQHEVADKVSLAQLAAGRVHALEDELGVVFSTLQRDVDDHQLREAGAEARQIVSDVRQLSFKESEIGKDPLGGLGGHRPVIGHEGEERVPVSVGKQQLVGVVAGLERVREVVGAEFLGRESGRRFIVRDRAGEGLEQDRDGRQPLLAVDDEEWRLFRHLTERLLDVDDGAHEMGGNVLVPSRPEKVAPELPAFCLFPAVGALEDRDHELRRFPHEFEQVRLVGLHLRLCSFGDRVIRRGGAYVGVRTDAPSLRPDQWSRGEDLMVTTADSSRPARVETVTSETRTRNARTTEVEARIGDAGRAGPTMIGMANYSAEQLAAIGFESGILRAALPRELQDPTYEIALDVSDPLQELMAHNLPEDAIAGIALLLIVSGLWEVVLRAKLTEGLAGLVTRFGQPPPSSVSRIRV